MKEKEIELNKVQTDTYLEKINEFNSGKPIQQIIKVVEFNGINIHIDNNVLIPRPETEYLADILTKALENVLSSTIDQGKIFKILEVGIGSGAICISLVKKLENYSNLELTGIDISSKAVAITKLNIEENRPLPKLKVKADEISSFGSTETYDLIVSNPPYIPSRKIKSLSKSVKNFEPTIALDGGKDGLKIIREIIEFGINNSSRNHELVIVLEINSKKQFIAIKKEFKYAFNEFKLLKDQYGRYRFLIISKTTSPRSIYHLL